jgi:hypothetical protein
MGYSPVATGTVREVGNVDAKALCNQGFTGSVSLREFLVTQERSCCRNICKGNALDTPCLKPAHQHGRELVAHELPLALGLLS